MERQPDADTCELDRSEEGVIVFVVAAARSHSSSLKTVRLRLRYGCQLNCRVTTRQSTCHFAGTADEILLRTTGKYRADRGAAPNETVKSRPGGLLRAARSA
jgi:hypothetical protein